VATFFAASEWGTVVLWHGRKPPIFKAGIYYPLFYRKVRSSFFFFLDSAGALFSVHLPAFFSFTHHVPFPPTFMVFQIRNVDLGPVFVDRPLFQPFPPGSSTMNRDFLNWMR